MIYAVSIINAAVSFTLFWCCVGLAKKVRRLEALVGGFLNIGPRPKVVRK